MLSYEKFKREIKAELYKLLASNYDGFAGWTLTDSTRYSINRRIDFLELRPPEGHYQENIMLPSYRYRPMYAGYTSGFSVRSIAEDIAESMVANLVSPPFPADQESCTEQVLNLEHIYIALINRRMNSALLKTVPHVDFLDLAVIFRVILPTDGKGEYSTIVTHDMLRELGKTTEELLALASENSMRDYPPMAEQRDETYSLTAENGTICSHALVCDQLLYDTAQKAGCNLFIVPITLKFSVAFPETEYTQSELEATSRNMSARLRDEDKLSDSLYYYDRSSHNLSLANCA